jgi:hypothetical protein
MTRKCLGEVTSASLMLVDSKPINRLKLGRHEIQSRRPRDAVSREPSKIISLGCMIAQVISEPRKIQVNEVRGRVILKGIQPLKCMRKTFLANSMKS